MQKLKRFTMHLAAATAGIVLAAQGVLADPVGAGVAIPFLTDITGVSTKILLTNLSGGDRVLYFDLLNGDPGEAWDSQSWQCTLTSGETVEILVKNDVFPHTGTSESFTTTSLLEPVAPSGNGSYVLFECDAREGVDPRFGGDAGNDGEILTEAERGVLWVTVQDGHGDTTAENVLTADFSIFDPIAGTAASAPAAHFPSFAGINNGDRAYSFFPAQPPEYAPFPSASATNYLPPASYPGALLAFTLDGVTGAAPPVRARVLWYDDDEHVEDDAFTFECMDVIPYEDIAGGLAALDTAGHMEMVAVEVPGDRKRPFLCYNLQDAPAGGTTMRACARSSSFFVPSGAAPYATPVLDTQL
jgi:hypothetical protein